MFSIITKSCLASMLFASLAAQAKCYQATLSPTSLFGSPTSDANLLLSWNGKLGDKGVVAVTSAALNKKVVAEFAPELPPTHGAKAETILNMGTGQHASVRCSVGDGGGEFIAVLNGSTVSKIRPLGQFAVVEDDDSVTGNLVIGAGRSRDVVLTATEDSVCDQAFYSKP